jgi:hypothetical protein
MTPGEFAKLRVGDRVDHPTLGDGVVQEIPSDGSNEVLVSLRIASGLSRLHMNNLKVITNTPLSRTPSANTTPAPRVDADRGQVRVENSPAAIIGFDNVEPEEKNFGIFRTSVVNAQTRITWIFLGVIAAFCLSIGLYYLIKNGIGYSINSVFEEAQRSRSFLIIPLVFVSVFVASMVCLIAMVKGIFQISAQTGLRLQGFRFTTSDIMKVAYFAPNADGDSILRAQEQANVPDIGRGTWTKDSLGSFNKATDKRCHINVCFERKQGASRLSITRVDIANTNGRESLISSWNDIIGIIDDNKYYCIHKRPAPYILTTLGRMIDKSGSVALIAGNIDFSAEKTSIGPALVFGVLGGAFVGAVNAVRQRNLTNELIRGGFFGQEEGIAIEKFLASRRWTCSVSGRPVTVK